MTTVSRRLYSFLLSLLVITIALCLQSGSAYAQGNIKSGFITDILSDLGQVSGQVMSLEGAMPQDKFTWRPGEGVRSVSETYLHIADGNYLVMSFTGVKSPIDTKALMDEKTRESLTTDKAKIAEALKVSFEWTKIAISKLTEADLQKKVEFFGQKGTVRSLVLGTITHIHEHLGQLVAYARMNGVVPPWTAAAQAQSKKNEEKKK